jgi:hypothetical protein
MPARLNTVLAPSRIVNVQVKWLVDTKRWPNGMVTSRLNRTTPLYFWEIEFDGITLAQWNALKAHYDSAKGRHLPFEFQDTHTNTVYSVRYASDLTRPPAVANVRGLYKLRINLEEDA